MYDLPDELLAWLQHHFCFVVHINGNSHEKGMTGCRAEPAIHAAIALGPAADQHACQVLLNIWADEIHRAHQRCMHEEGCDPSLQKSDFVFEAGQTAMRLMEGAYSCISLVKDVGLVAFRDPFGIRSVSGQQR